MTFLGPRSGSAWVVVAFDLSSLSPSDSAHQQPPCRDQEAARGDSPGRGEVAASSQGRGRAGQQGRRGWAGTAVVARGSVCGVCTGPGGTGYGSGRGAVWPRSCVKLAQGRCVVQSKANKETEPMRHTEVKMDRSQSTTPSELYWRSRQSVILSRMRALRRRHALPAGQRLL